MLSESERADHPLTGHPVAAGDDAPQPDPISAHQEARDAEYSRVMAEKAKDRETIRTLKKLLWREVARHRRAHRYTNAKDIEIALHRMN
jgi:hypothetical protein